MKKFGVLFVAMLVALGLVGATYAYWEDSLSISGSVSTGNLDVQFSNGSPSDNEGTYDVGDVSCEITGAKTAKITVTNAYPGYVATCTFTIENTGTIPAKISETVNNNNDEIDVSTSWNGLDANNVLGANGGVATLTVQTTVTESAQEDGYYEYTITINVGQFNE